jgi:hypothetical protein
MLLLSLKALFGLLVLTIASLGAGSWISNLLPSAFNRLDRIAVGFLAGFGLLSLVLFIVGQFSFTRKTIVIVMGVVIVASVRSLLSLARDSLALVKSLRRAAKIPLILVGLVLLLTAVAGLNEMTGDSGSDTIAYHLLGPKVWLRNGVIRPVPDNCHTAFPQTAETMYGVLFAIGGARAPGFSSFVTFGMLLLITSSVAMRSGLDASGAWWVAALVATMPAVYNGSVGGFVDGIYAAFVLAAIRIGADAERKLDWAIFGIFCGLAMGTKYTGILALPVLLLCLAWLHARLEAKNWIDISKAVLVAIGVACVVAAPYYLRNWILLGCPIYPPPPGFAHLCSPRYLSPEVVAQFHAYIRQRGAGLGRGFLAFLLLPFNLTYHTSNFHGAGGIGLAPLALGPIGIIASRKNRLVKTLVVIGLLLLVTWFVTQQESRFLIHVYILAVILAVIGWRQMFSGSRSLTLFLAASVVAVSVGYGSFMIGKTWLGSVHASLSPTYAAAGRRSNIPFFESFQYLNTSSDVRRVLILDWSVPPYYSDKDYIKPVGRWGERTLPEVSTPAEALDRTRELGVSHILDVNSNVAPFQIVEPRTGVTLVFEARNQRIYRVD